MTTRREVRDARQAVEALPLPDPAEFEVVTGEILTSLAPLPGQPLGFVGLRSSVAESDAAAGGGAGAASAEASATGTTPTDTGAQWTEPQTRPVRVAGFAFIASFLSLVLSCFVGWALPLALIVLALSLMAVRRPDESRVFAWWALGMASLACAYSAGWIIWALTR